MADIFARTELGFGGAFAADHGLINAEKLSGILMQSLQLTYMQNVARIYELGASGQKANMYYVGGRSQGNMSAAHIIGPNLKLKEFYVKYSDVCAAGTNSIAIKLSKGTPSLPGGQQGPVNNACLASDISYTAKYCVLTQVGISTQSQDLIINESSQLMFSNLEYTGV